MAYPTQGHGPSDLGWGEGISKKVKAGERMELKTGIYEVINADKTTSVHGDFENITTTHVKSGWIRNLNTQDVSNVTLTNFSMPLIPGNKIAIAFLNGEIIAFKRSAEIPVEDPVGAKAQNNMLGALVAAIFFSLVVSIPVLGYIGGAVAGAYSLVTGNNILGRYKRVKGNRLYGAFLLGASLFAWIPAQAGHGDLKSIVNQYITLAILVMTVTVIAQIRKVKREINYYAKAVQDLNTAWRK